MKRDNSIFFSTLEPDIECSGCGHHKRSPASPDALKVFFEIYLAGLEGFLVVCDDNRTLSQGWVSCDTIQTGSSLAVKRFSRGTSFLLLRGRPHEAFRRSRYSIFSCLIRVVMGSMSKENRVKDHFSVCVSQPQNFCNVWKNVRLETVLTVILKPQQMPQRQDIRWGR